MKSSVKITANKDGNVFTPGANLGKDGKVYGFIRVQQTLVDLSGAFARTKTISALKSISQDDYNKAKDFLKEGTELPGNIVRLESLEEKPGFTPKMAGDSGVECKVNGKVIYQSTILDNTGRQDELIAHDNVEEIKKALALKSADQPLNS